MENARLVRWLKQVGDTVAQGEPILELETEKSLVEIEATETGRLVEQLLAVDAEVHVGDQAASLETDKPDTAGVAEKADSLSSPRAASNKTAASTPATPQAPPASATPTAAGGPAAATR